MEIPIYILNILFAHSSGEIFYRIKDGKRGQIGLEFPTMIRYGNYSVPEGSYELKNTIYFTSGANVVGTWKFGKYLISSAVGKLFAYPSTYWSIKLQRFF